MPHATTQAIALAQEERQRAQRFANEMAMVAVRARDTQAKLASVDQEVA